MTPKAAEASPRQELTSGNKSDVLQIKQPSQHATQESCAALPFRRARVTEGFLQTVRGKNRLCFM